MVGTQGAAPRVLSGQRPALPPLHLVRTHEVVLAFQVPGVGSSGLGSIDVYLTADEGDSWEKWEFSDFTFPHADVPGGTGVVPVSLTVRLPHQSVIYGLYLLPKSGAGMGKPPPSPGAVPHVRIEVDATLPVAELYAPQIAYDRPGALVLTWKAEDRNLAVNPISLEWAAQPTGPWEFIGEPQLPNTGRYTWQVPEKVPPKVFLRLSVRDAAGNVAVAETPESVLIDLSIPGAPVNIRVSPGQVRADAPSDAGRADAWSPFLLGWDKFSVWSSFRSLFTPATAPGAAR
jgi:hypothetical protein